MRQILTLEVDITFTAVIHRWRIMKILIWACGIDMYLASLAHMLTNTFLTYEENRHKTLAEGKFGAVFIIILL